MVTTSCPHCKHKSPAVKRDGFTKLFVKPLAARNALVVNQSKNLKSKARSRSKDSAGADATETHTVASTAGGGGVLS